MLVICLLKNSGTNNVNFVCKLFVNRVKSGTKLACRLRVNTRKLTMSVRHSKPFQNHPNRE